MPHKKSEQLKRTCFVLIVLLLHFVENNFVEKHVVEKHFVESCRITLLRNSSLVAY